jgi:hypothetical protein
MSRYCILSLPRTGSTWLLEGIASHLLSTYTDKNFINLGEFLTLSINESDKYIKYYTDENKLIQQVKQLDKVPENSEYVLSFINKRLSILLDGTNQQSIILKYMYSNHVDHRINDLENLTKIKNHDFTIVNINRDPFESALSYLVSKQTNNWIKSTLWDNKNIESVTASSVTIPINYFKITYNIFLRVSKEKQKVTDDLNCVSVNYKSLVQDCIANQIPFEENNNCQKLYNIDYNSIVTNYDEILSLKSDNDNIR